jgi:hypothetical protein
MTITRNSLMGETADDLHFPVPRELEAALEALYHAWPVMQGCGTPCPFENSAARYECAVFQVHAYSWGNEDQPWNFKWRDITVRWYKYFGRGMSVNRKTTEAEARELLQECMAAMASPSTLKD